jgi:hypothetical protein
MWEKLITNYFQHCFVGDHPLDLLLGEGRKEGRTPYCGGCSTSDSRFSQIFAPNWNVLKTWEPATVWARTLTRFALSPSYNCCCRSHNSTQSPLPLWTLHLGDSEPAPTSAPSTGCPLLLSCGLNLNWLNIWFQLANQFCKKYISYIGR